MLALKVLVQVIPGLSLTAQVQLLLAMQQASLTPKVLLVLQVLLALPLATPPKLLALLRAMFAPASLVRQLAQRMPPVMP